MEHVVPWSLQGVNAVNQVLRMSAILVDAADLKLMKKPRVWWTNVEMATNLIKSGNPRCQWQAKVTGIKPILPAEIKVGSIEGVKYRLHKDVLQGRSLLPCPTRQADGRGWTLPASTDWSDRGALQRHQEDGRKYAPWHYKEKNMLIPVWGQGKMRTLSIKVKEQAQMFPQGYFESAVLKEVLDPEKVKADWLANTWHLGVAEFLVRLVLNGELKWPHGPMVVAKQKPVVHPNWISTWGGSQLDQLGLLIPAFGVQNEALPRRLKMGSSRMIWEDRDPVRHLHMAKEAVHPADEDI